MKKSAGVRLTVVAAIAIAARAQGPADPCAAATFNEQACRDAVQAQGYCWNGRWVKLKYHYPYPYYFDSYLSYIGAGGTINAADVGSCGPPRSFFLLGHSTHRAGFGGTGAGHAAHC